MYKHGLPGTQITDVTGRTAHYKTRTCFVRSEVSFEMNKLTNTHVIIYFILYMTDLHCKVVSVDLTKSVQMILRVSFVNSGL